MDDAKFEELRRMSEEELKDFIKENFEKLLDASPELRRQRDLERQLEARAVEIGRQHGLGRRAMLAALHLEVLVECGEDSEEAKLLQFMLEMEECERGRVAARAWCKDLATPSAAVEAVASRFEEWLQQTEEAPVPIDVVHETLPPHARREPHDYRRSFIEEVWRHRKRK
jgi:hypothetical protein